MVINIFYSRGLNSLIHVPVPLVLPASHILWCTLISSILGMTAVFYEQLYEGFTVTLVC